MRIPAAAAVAPCHVPAGAERVTSPGKKILICRSPGSGEPGPGTTAYVTPTASHRRSCPASPGTPGPGAAAGAVAGFQRARRSLSASSPDVPALGAQRRQRHAGRASLAREREGPQRRHLALNLAGAAGRDDRPDRLRGPYYLQRRGHPALPGRAALTRAGAMTFGPCGPGLSALAALIGAMQRECRLRGDRGSWTERSAGETRRREERLRGRGQLKGWTATPRDLIRAMPAKGDRPAGLFCPGGHCGHGPGGADSGGSQQCVRSRCSAAAPTRR